MIYWVAIILGAVAGYAVYWIKKKVIKPTEDDLSVKITEHESYEDAMMTAAMRAFTTGKPCHGEWDGKKLTSRVYKKEE